jgi:hypothetical protein
LPVSQKQRKLLSPPEIAFVDGVRGSRREIDKMRNFPRGAAALWAAACALIGGASAQSLTADEIIRKNVEARGGAEALTNLKALRREGRLVIPGFNAELNVAETKQRGGGYRMEVTFQGLTQVVAYDGRETWQIDPFAGRKDPERLAPDSQQAKSAALSADIDTPLVDYRTKGARAEYLGEEDVDGTPAHKLRMTLKSGDVATYFIDPDSWMIIRLLEKQLVRGAESEAETDFGEYEKVGGVYVPMTEEFGEPGTPSTAKQKFVFEKAESVEPMPTSHFAFPAGK